MITEKEIYSVFGMSRKGYYNEIDRTLDFFYFSDHKRLTIFMDQEDNKTYYLKSWGVNIHTEMEDGIVKGIKDLEKLRRWLYET